ncbi:MAG: hypothetical protein ACRDD7_06765 [Peptostreptococcaceae bacterium]
MEVSHITKSKKIVQLMIKLTTGETMTIEGHNIIDRPEVISQRIENKEDIIIFGSMGIKRELIEWYTVSEL